MIILLNLYLTRLKCNTNIIRPANYNAFISTVIQTWVNYIHKASKEHLHDHNWLQSIVNLRTHTHTKLTLWRFLNCEINLFLTSYKFLHFVVYDENLHAHGTKLAFQRWLIWTPLIGHCFHSSPATLKLFFTVHVWNDQYRERRYQINVKWIEFQNGVSQLSCTSLIPRCNLSKNSWFFLNLIIIRVHGMLTMFIHANYSKEPIRRNESDFPILRSKNSWFNQNQAPPLLPYMRINTNSTSSITPLQYSS